MITSVQFQSDKGNRNPVNSPDYMRGQEILFMVGITKNLITL